MDPKNPCILLSDAANKIGCTVDELIELDLSGEISIRASPSDNNYIWRYTKDHKITKPVHVIAGDSFFLYEDDLNEIMTNGKALVNHTEDGYLSKSDKFKFSKVAITFQQLAISESEFKYITEPDSIENTLKISDSDVDNPAQEIKETSGDNLDQLSETERKTLLKIIGLLSMVLSKKSNNLVKSSGNINISQVSEMLIKEIGTSGYEETKGLSQSNIRSIIANSLSLLNK